MIWHKNVSKPVNISGRITHKLHVLKMKDQDPLVEKHRSPTFTF